VSRQPAPSLTRYAKPWLSYPDQADFAVQWQDRLLQVLAKHPNTPQALVRMGMPANWNKHPVWK
jgi:hypothetical protein